MLDSNYCGRLGRGTCCSTNSYTITKTYDVQMIKTEYGGAHTISEKEKESQKRKREREGEREGERERG